MLTSAPSGRVIALDGLRGIAIGGVLLAHLLVTPLDPVRFAWLRGPLGLSTHGVDLFFVLSGYLIGGILMDHRSSPRRFSTFWLRRFFRIVPLYAITLILLLGVMLKVANAAAPWWSYALFVSNSHSSVDGYQHWPPVGVMWSLSVEEQFYLFAPALIFFCRADRLPRYLAGIIFCSYVARWIILFGWGAGHLGIHFLTVCRADTLAFGMLVAWLVRHPEDRAYQWIQARWPVLTACATAVVLVFALTDTSLGNIHGVAFGYGAIGVLSSLVVFSTSNNCAPWLRPLLESRVLVSFGRYAFFLYLWHQIFAFVINKLTTGQGFPQFQSLGDLWRPVAIVGVTWAAATASWRFFEEPLIKLGHRAAY